MTPITANSKAPARVRRDEQDTRELQRVRGRQHYDAERLVDAETQEVTVLKVLQCVNEGRDGQDQRDGDQCVPQEPRLF
jgi:hypothetical protein